MYQLSYVRKFWQTLFTLTTFWVRTHTAVNGADEQIKPQVIKHHVKRLIMYCMPNGCLAIVATLIVQDRVVGRALAAKVKLYWVLSQRPGHIFSQIEKQFQATQWFFIKWKLRPIFPQLIFFSAGSAFWLWLLLVDLCIPPGIALKF